MTCIKLHKKTKETKES